VYASAPTKDALLEFIPFGPHNSRGKLVQTGTVRTRLALLTVTIGIVAINFILRMFIIKLIIYIGKDTESEQTRLITNGVFIVQFFNTALLLLMVNANMTEQGWFFGIFSRDTGLPDFNSSWFKAQFSSSITSTHQSSTSPS